MRSEPADRAPSLNDVRAAAGRIAGFVHRTPLEHSHRLSDAAGTAVHLKLECWQRTRSFKVRGAHNAISLLGPAGRARGLVTASAGNHGMAVALAAREFQAKATVFIPHDAPGTKRSRILRLGAAVHDEARDYDEAEELARDFARYTGAAFVHAFSDPAVVAGQGTVALEILDELPAIRDVIVPVGGGGLAAGVGIVVKARAPAARVVGVQSTETRAMYEAFRANRVVDVPVPPTLADGLAGCTDGAAYEAVRDVVEDIVLVEEAEIASAIRELHAEEGIVAEGAGAVAVAAVLSGRIRTRGPAVVLVTGGNIDGALLAGLLADVRPA
ncbi:MAG TPA: threonine/serine dehydratase [Longimicrobiales bacterium]|nr:threonine/serine dehydratase [Longimicrobiales bacterium]